MMADLGLDRRRKVRRGMEEEVVPALREVREVVFTRKSSRSWRRFLITSSSSL